jgi:hypothetical protein
VCEEFWKSHPLDHAAFSFEHKAKISHEGVVEVERGRDWRVDVVAELPSSRPEFSHRPFVLLEDGLVADQVLGGLIL